MSDASRIAVVGMSCRFPDAITPAKFYANLIAGKSSVRRFDREELLRAGVARSLIDHPRYIPYGATLEGIDLFDAKFFGYSDREAAMADPQQRVLLKCVWEAFEDAGRRPSKCKETAVFLASAMSSYFFRKLAGKMDVSRATSFLPGLIAGDKDYTATRVSYALDFRGPAMSVQTACSSSLVAVTMACEALLNCSADFAIAGGASIRLPHRAGYLFEEGAILSSDGVCRPFDARASGTIFGHGAGVVLLRRLEDAIADGDRVYAVVRGFAVNNDGASKVGFVAPSVEGQASCVSAALGHAGVEPSDLSFIECHGTGTLVGDAIEAEALRSCFGDDVREKCYLGSVKSNVGHLDTAAGMAGFIKAALALHHGVLPATINFETPSPGLRFDDTAICIAAKPVPLTPSSIGGVSSFGIGGTNAHVVLQAAQRIDADRRSSRIPVFVINARSAGALPSSISNAISWSEAVPVRALDAAFVSAVGRERLACSEAVAIGKDEPLYQAFKRLKARRSEATASKGVSRPAFVFSGEGGGTAGAVLYQEFAAFRTAFDQCRAIVAALTGRGLDEICWGRAETVLERRIAEFCVEHSVAVLLISLGVKPVAVAGRGVGTIVAAAIAGVLELSSALKCIICREPDEIEKEIDRRIESSLTQVPLIRAGSREPLQSGDWPVDESCDQGSKAAIVREWQGSLSEYGVTDLVEIATRPHLVSLGDGERLQAAVSPFDPSVCEARNLAVLLTRLYNRGIDIDWDEYYRDSGARRCSLPTYPFEERRHWIDDEQIDPRRFDGTGSALGTRIAGFRLIADFDHEQPENDFVHDHVIRGVPVFPAMGYIALIRRCFPEIPIAIADLTIDELWPIPEGIWSLQLQVRDANDKGTSDFRFLTNDGKRWKSLSHGRLEFEIPEGLLGLPLNLEAAAEETEDFYDFIRAQGVEYGQSYRQLVNVKRAPGKATARLALANNPELTQVLDSALQAIALAGRDLADGLHLPTRIGSCVFHRDGADPARVEARARRDGGRVLAEACVRDSGGLPRVSFSNLECRPAQSLFVGEARTYRREWKLSELQPSTIQTVDLVLLPSRWEFADVGSAPSFATMISDGTRNDDGAERSTLERELGRLTASDRPLRILDLRGVDDRAMDRRVADTLELVQTLARDGRAFDCVIATRGAIAVADMPLTDPVGAALWGLGCSAAAEAHDLRVKMVDVDPRLPAGSQFDVLLREAGSVEDIHVAYRDGRRLRPVLVELQVGDRRKTGLIRNLQDSGCCIVTGAGGGLAPIVVAWLASCGFKRLVLIARAGLATDDIAELGGTTGAVIDVRPLDVTSASQIAELVGNLNADGLRVQCVVHLAGKVLDAPLAATNFDAFLHVMRPKVLGATILHEATKHDQPLFILFSSLASIVGSPGQASYSAANSFLDSFSTWRAQEGFPTVCVSWGPWEAPGMARRFGLDKFRRRGLTPLSSAQAIEALAAIDPEQDRHLIVADFHWPTFIRGHDQRLVRSIVPDAFQAVKPTMPRGGFRNALLGRQLGDRQHLLSRKISEAVAATLGVAPSEVSDTVAFLDLGLDSLMTVELKEELEHALDASISIAAFVDHGTPAQLARHVLGDLLPVEEEPKSSRAQEWNDDLMTDLRFRLEKA